MGLAAMALSPFHTFSTALFMPLKTSLTEFFRVVKVLVTVPLTQLAAAEAAALIPSHTPEMTEEIAFQMDETVSLTAVNAVVTTPLTNPTAV